MSIWKESARAATTANLELESPVSVVDGVVLAAGDRVVVKNQTAPATNGIYIFTGPPLNQLQRTDTTEPESVIRISEGHSNAHTQWALRTSVPIITDKTPLLFLRQDVKNYSFDSVATLKEFSTGMLMNATASVAGYYAPGDKGGGDFTFIGVPSSAHVASVSSVDRPITAVSSGAGLVTITAPGHGLGDTGNVTMTFISNVSGLANQAYSITVVDADAFSLNALSGASFAAGARVQYIRLTTTAEHGRTTGQRIALSGVANSPDAADIRGLHNLCGVIDATSLSIPIPATGGTYLPGTNAVIGDDGLTVPATDPAGTYGGLWQRSLAAHIDVRWFGAKPDWEWNRATGTDNLAVFNAVIAAMSEGHNKANRLVADGWFYFSDTLVLTRTIVFEGTGQNEPTVGGVRSAPGTWLIFPRNVTGIRIHSAAPLDNPRGTGERTVLRNLTIYCKETGTTGHGIHASATVHLANVTVEYFAQDGIHVEADADLTGTGSAYSTVVENSKAGQCGRDGFHFAGQAASGCAIIGCQSLVNQRYGFYDSSQVNTYISCIAEGNVAAEYWTEGTTNTSVFAGCYAEANQNKSHFGGPVTIIGGTLGRNYITKESEVFILEHGIASRAPFVYDNARGTTRIESYLGSQDGDQMNAFKWVTPDPPNFDFSTLTYVDAPETPGHRWWALKNGSDYRHVVRFPTTQSNARQAAPWFMNGIFLGRDDAPAMLCFTAGPSPQNEQYSGYPLTYWKGDVVWNSDPSPGGTLGHVCVQSGTQGTLNGDRTTGTIAAGTDKLLVNDYSYLEVGQYIAIAGVSGTKKIQALDLSQRMVTVDTVADMTVEGAAISLVGATFRTFGGVDAASTSYAEDHTLGLEDRYVTVTVTGKTMTLPSSPPDGQTHDIKSQAGVSTTVVTADGVLTIDGAATATVTEGQNQRFRYSAATGEWERR